MKLFRSKVKRNRYVGREFQCLAPNKETVVRYFWQHLGIVAEKLCNQNNDFHGSGASSASSDEHPQD